jgi:DNA-binding response OmpR family regulator
MGTTSRILVVEDETDLADLLTYNLQKAGFEVDVCHDGRSGLHRASELQPDLIILDVMLPHISGLQVARQIRTSPRTASIPILMLTAKAEEMDQISGLQSGADDYVTKPFSVKILVARVEAMLRRSRGVAGASSDAIVLGPVQADLSTHEVTVDASPIKLTLTEFRLLVAMMRKPGKVLSRADLMYSAMGPSVLVTTRTIDVHVASIRKKLGIHANMIRTIRGVGYLMTEDATAPASASELEE